MSQSYAIIPAAGRSLRMGRPKLLLPWGEGTILDAVLSAWTSSSVSDVVVVVRQDDEDLKTVCERWPVRVVQPKDDPPDMKESVWHGLKFLGESAAPTESDVCLVAPADLPGITPALIDRLLEGVVDKSSIVVPMFGSRRGHPIVIPWPLTVALFDLKTEEGIDSFVGRQATTFVPLPAANYISDIDTPKDYLSAQDEELPGGL